MRFRLRTLASLLAVALLAALAAPSPAGAAPLLQKMLGGAAGTKADKAGNPAGPTDAGAAEQPIAERRAALEKQLAAAQLAVSQEREGTYATPAGATPAEVTELGWLLGRIASVLQAQLDLLQEIEAARGQRAAAERADKAWKAPETPGPYALTDVDRTLDALDAERVRLHSFSSVAELQQTELARLEALLKTNQAAERLAVEKATQGIAAPLEIARLRVRRTSEQLQLLRLQGELNAELKATATARVALLERQSAALAANFQFTQSELDRVLKSLQDDQVALDKRLEDVAAQRARVMDERDRAREALARLPAATTVAEVRTQAELQAQVDAANATLEALRTEASALTTLRGINPLAAEAWRLRFTALTSTDADERLAAEKALEAAMARVGALKTYSADLYNLAEATVQSQQRRLDALDAGAPGRSYEQAALSAAQRARAAVNDVQGLSQRVGIAHERWRREYRGVSGQRTAGERAADVGAEVRDVARSVWNFELFAVEDTVDIGGKQVTLSRGVTVGKSVGALLIFLIGLKIVGFFASRAQRIMVQRFEVDEAQARVLRRWIMLLTGFILLVLTLNLARIPLTVFAFMGGALAIGIGFGTQTLLRNFISGIIVLFERKVRVGDIVDVDGVQGVVTAVDIRSTTVRQFDGIETMVPNSLLLEQKVTNWTGESPTMRRVVRVGVAYGSNTRQVADILAGVAAEHGRVLKDPAPFVVFEDFGDNALVFALYFWVDLIKSNGMQVMSDLRFMLEKRFAEAGISIAFPQRDIHLDTARPLQIEVLPPAAASGAAAPGSGSIPRAA
jgi:small-conductance mechanosensitive channel